MKNLKTGIVNYLSKYYNYIIAEDDFERRLELVKMYCLFIVVFSTPMIIVNLMQNQNLFAFLVLIFWLTAGAALILIKHRKKTGIWGTGVLVVTNIFAVYLIYSGGVSNNGHLWVMFIPILTVFVYGTKKGLISLTIMTLFFIIMFSYPENLLLKAMYPLDFKIRFIIAFLGLTLFSASAEIARVRATLKLKERNAELKKAITNIKELSGLLPICSHCKKIRDDQGYWSEVEEYLMEHSKADFSHSLCPHCASKLYPEYYK